MMDNKFPKGQPSQAVWNDYIDFKIKINDNGDDKVTFTGKQRLSQIIEIM